jgi:hypothetical protein
MRGVGRFEEGLFVLTVPRTSRQAFGVSRGRLDAGNGIIGTLGWLGVGALNAETPTFAGAS